MPVQDERTVPEALPRKEPVCNRVVFGEGDEIDTDQMWTYCVARKLYFIPPDAAITATYGVYNHDLQDPKCLVIEGTKKDSELRNVNGFNNFDNGPDGEGAIEMALRNPSYLNSKRGVPQGERAKFDVLIDWMKYSESDKRRDLPFPDLKGQFKREELEAVSAIFHALRWKAGNKPETVLEQSYSLFQDLLNPFRTQLIQEQYQDVLEDYKKALDADKIIMEEAIREGKLRSIKTLAGFNLAYFDVSELPLQAHYGAMDLARDNSDADIVLLIDELNGKKQVKISISQAKAATNPSLAQINLGEVIPFALKPFEALEAGGYEFAVNSEAGGHEHIAGMAREGTTADPNKIRQAITKLFDTIPMTQTQLAEASKQIASLIGNDPHYFPELSELDTGTFNLNRRVVRFNVQAGDKSQYVDIREDEVEIYLEALKNDPQKAREIFLKKTAASEPEEVIAIKAQRAAELLPEYLAAQDGERVLAALDQMTELQIKMLSIEQKVKIIEAIALSNAAIDFVWNPKNDFYQIHDPALFTHVRNNADLYQRARFFYPSIQRTIDGLLVPDCIERTSEKRSIPLQRDIAAYLLRIVTSETYKKSHKEMTHDSLLASTLRFIADRRNDTDTRNQVAQAISSHYGIEQINHWKQLADLDESLLSTIFDSYPDLFNDLREQIEIKPAADIPGIPEAKVFYPDREQVNSSIEAQAPFIEKCKVVEKIDVPPAVNIALQIMRPTKQLAEAYGVITRHTGAAGQRIIAPVEMNAEVNVPGLLQLENATRTMADSDDPKIGRCLVEQVRQLGAISTNADIRVFMGGSPDPLTSFVSNQFILSPDLTPEVKKRIMMVYYNQQDKVFYERPVILPEQYPLIDAMASLKS